MVFKEKIKTNASIKANTFPVEICGHSCTKWAASSLWDPSFPSRECPQHSPYTDFISLIWLACTCLLLRLTQSQKVKVISFSSGSGAHVSKVLPRVIFRTPSPTPSPPWCLVGPVRARGRGVVGEKGKSSTMTSLTWCPEHDQYNFTTPLQRWIYDFLPLDLYSWNICMCLTLHQFSGVTWKCAKRPSIQDFRHEKHVDNKWVCVQLICRVTWQTGR